MIVKVEKFKTMILQLHAGLEFFSVHQELRRLMAHSNSSDGEDLKNDPPPGDM